MGEPEVLFFNDPDKGRKRTRISNKDKKKLREGDVAELFTLPGPVTSTNTTATTHLDKTWSKSDLSTTIKEISVLADTLTQQMETDKSQSKVQLRGRQRNVVKSYPQIQREKKEKELQKKEEQGISGIAHSVTNRKDKHGDRRRHTTKGKGRWKDNIKGLDPPMGRFKNGVLSLSQKEVKKISKSSL